MNFLAHAFLAADDDALIAGGVLGDWIKGPLAGQPWPADFLRGVALHRAIDTFADGHPAFRRSRARVSAGRRRWSGVLVDMYYDHLLAARWTACHAMPLDDFTARVYAALLKHTAGQTEELIGTVHLMRREDWLGSYAQIEGLAAILGRMGRRARQPNPLADGVEDLLADGAGFAADLAEFLPAARTFAREWISRVPPNAGSV